MFTFMHGSASYAAALPQPAELSEKYSNNVDTTLAYGLEARSYQPGSNSHKESATLMSLERRGGSGSRQPPSFPPVPKREYRIPFTNNDVSSENLAFIIGKVRDGAFTFVR
ncbi:hypothetical protein BASA83_012709 [Batrachochytrium salamandrivorans]|nr:hypothetical protein BASA83_012709 [Batrachochytrium salamandrivorans]